MKILLFRVSHPCPPGEDARVIMQRNRHPVFEQSVFQFSRLIVGSTEVLQEAYRRMREPEGLIAYEMEIRPGTGCKEPYGAYKFMPIFPYSFPLFKRR